MIFWTINQLNQLKIDIQTKSIELIALDYGKSERAIHFQLQKLSAEYIKNGMTLDEALDKTKLPPAKYHEITKYIKDRNETNKKKILIKSVNLYLSCLSFDEIKTLMVKFLQE